MSAHSRRKSKFEYIVEEWEIVNKEFSDLEAQQKAYVKTAKELKEYEQKCKKQVDSQLKGVMRILQSIKCYREVTEESEKEEIKELKLKATVRKQELNEILSKLPRNSGVYLGIVLGNVDVTLLDANAKYKYKDEYEKFKLIITGIVLFLSFVNIVTVYRALDAILHFLLVWYYCTLTIRESILKANGSRIKGWWRAHHFITTVLTGVLILWPDGETYQEFRLQFMWYCCYSSFVQYLQYRYQQGCLYRLRALGERYKMDITVDGFHSWMWKGLQFLLPFLSIGYAWQLYNSVTLYHLWESSTTPEWQVAVSSALFLILFSGNTLTTIMVIQQKFSVKGLTSKKSD